MSRHYPTVGINSGDLYRFRGDAVADGVFEGILLPSLPVGNVTVIVTPAGINAAYSGGASLCNVASHVLPVSAYSVSNRLVNLTYTPVAGEVYSVDYITKTKPGPLDAPVFSAPQDPFFSAVQSLLHFNGANGSTTFTDVTGRTWTPTNAVLSTAWDAFGTASGLFASGSTPSYLETASSSDFEITNRDFFIEATIRLTSVPTTAGHYAFIANKDFPGGTRSWQFGVSGDSGGKLFFGIFSGASLTTVGGSTVLSANTPYTVAAGRTGGVISIFLNGALEGTASVGSTSNNVSSNTVRLGINGVSASATQLSGYIDEFRFTLGTCRHTSNYTVADAPFPDF